MDIGTGPACRVVAAFALLAGQAPVLGQTPVPEELKTLLAHAREHSREHRDTRGATADFARIKSLLRGWVESRLTPPTRTGEDTVLAYQLNAELAMAGMECDEQAGKCPDQDLTGFLGEIKLRRSGEFLIAQTAVGIQCGYDESAYIYQWKDSHWQRYWESEQNNYAKDKYLPENLRGVFISPTDNRPDGDKMAHVIVTLGTYPRCSSNWYPIYYRIWRTQSGVPPSLLLNENEIAYLAEPIQAAVWPDDVLIEYAVSSIDVALHNRRQIRHYVVNQGSLRRVDPVFWVRGTSSSIGSKVHLRTF